MRIRRSDPKMTIGAGKQVNVSVDGVPLHHDGPLDIGAVLHIKSLKPESLDFSRAARKP